LKVKFGAKLFIVLINSERLELARIAGGRSVLLLNVETPGTPTILTFVHGVNEASFKTSTLVRLIVNIRSGSSTNEL
jgi:hypothetical protein